MRRRQWKITESCEAESDDVKEPRAAACAETVIYIRRLEPTGWQLVCDTLSASCLPPTRTDREMPGGTASPTEAREARHSVGRRRPSSKKRDCLINIGALHNWWLSGPVNATWWSASTRRSTRSCGQQTDSVLWFLVTQWCSVL